MKIAIVGAGISGLCLAVTLKKKGINAQVFEQFTESKAVGAGMTLWPNATRVLRDLDVLESLQKHGNLLEHFCLRNFDGHPLMKIRIDSFDTSSIAVHRADLHHALLSLLAPEQFHLGQICERVFETNEGAYLTFTQQTLGPFDLVVAADGLHSRLRSYVQPTRTLRNNGYVVWRGIANCTETILSPGAFSETWGKGHRFGILPLGNGQTCWYATANLNQLPENQFSTREYLVKTFGKWHDPIPRILQQTHFDSIIRSEALDSRPEKSWARGKVVLMGDNVHPMVPNLGQGGCMSIEDAMVLGSLIGGDLPLDKILGKYEKYRANRVAGITRRARWIGWVGQLQHPWITTLRNFLCRLFPGSLITLSSRRIHAYRVTHL